jgi:hypothetical protein
MCDFSEGKTVKSQSQGARRTDLRQPFFHEREKISQRPEEKQARCQLPRQASPVFIAGLPYSSGRPFGDPRITRREECTSRPQKPVLGRYPAIGATLADLLDIEGW